jgi:hypothetical protein
MTRKESNEDMVKEAIAHVFCSRLVDGLNRKSRWDSELQDEFLVIATGVNDPRWNPSHSALAQVIGDIIIEASHVDPAVLLECAKRYL